MSSKDTTTLLIPGRVAPGESHDVRLTEEEQRQVVKLLGDPTYFPIEFKTWLKNYIETAGIEISPSQITTGGGAQGSVLLPAGIILVYCGDKYAPNSLPCNGAAISRTDYARLFDQIGTKWGNGDGSSTFNVPDFRDRALFMAGSVVGLGATDGRGMGNRGGPNHCHSFSGSTSSSGAHGHSVSGSVGGAGDHAHGSGGSGRFMCNPQTSYFVPGGGGVLHGADSTDRTSNAGAHGHSFSGSASGVGDHNHSFGGTTSGGYDQNRVSYAGVQFVITTGK